MLVNVYAIYDSKVRAYLQPWFSPTHAAAFRNCEMAGRNPSSPFKDFPADFTLFCIGTFDDEKGVLIPADAAENMGNFIQFMPMDSSPPAMPADTGLAVQ